MAGTSTAILDALPANIAMLDSQGVIVAVNERWRCFSRQNGMQGPDFGVGQNYLALCDRVTGDGAATARKTVAGLQAILNGASREFTLDYPCHAPEEQHWFRLIATPVQTGRGMGVMVSHLEISAQKLAEERLARINRLYLVLSRLNETIVRTRDRQQLFEAACRIAVEQGLFRMAAVLEVAEETGTARPLAHAGWEEGYFSEILVSVLDSQRNCGTIGTSIRNKTCDICNDFANDPRMAAWREPALRRDYRSTASFPLMLDGKVMGVFVLFASEVNYFREDEVELLTAVQKDLSFAIEALRQEQQRKQAEAALAAMQRQQKQVLESVGEGIHGIDKLGRIVFENPASAVLLGMREEEMVGRDAHSLIHHHGADGRVYPLEECPIYQTLRDGKERQVDNEVFFRKDGTSFPVEYLCSPMNDESGEITGAVVCFRDVSEQRAAREQLEHGAALLRIAGRVSRLGGWVIEMPERKLTWSDQTCIIHDVPPGYQPTLEEGLALFPPEHRGRVVALVEACARDGTPYDFEVPKITAKGRLIWVRSIGEAVRDAEGKIIRLQGAFQDITERKLAELELARSNRALRMLSSCGEALTRINDEKQLLQEICRLAVEIGGYHMAWVGYALDDEMRSIRPMAHAGEESGYLGEVQLTWDENQPAGRGPAGRAIRTGKAMVCPDILADDVYFHYRTEALTRRYRGIICLPLREGERTFGMLGLYSSEINQPSADEIKLIQELADDLAFGIASLRAREEHRRSQREMTQKAALLDLATDAIMVLDLDYRVIFWNKSAARIYGWPQEEVLGRSTRDFLFTSPFSLGDARRALLSKGEWHCEIDKKTKSGQVITVDCRWTLVRDEQGQPASVLCIETDVTGKKKLEAQFFRAQRMESIGTLAGGIAHDLNNVLAPILVSVQMLREQANQPDAIEILDTLETCTQRGADLVRQVLVFGRGIEGQRVKVNLARLLLELHKVLREVFPKNIEIDFVEKSEVWTVTGDPTQLHQVFLNLCVNARDAMPNGGKLGMAMENVTVDETYVAMNPDSKTGNYLLVTVADSGMGIPSAILDKIFEPFFTTKELGKGTGLGLSTVLGIVKSHDGFINVYSEPGKGTQFKVYLPASSTTDEQDALTKERPGLPFGQGELILLVDDEQSIRETTARTLERFGYRVLTAANGAEAVALYVQRQKDIALVLTDVSMPIMDGASLVLALRAVNAGVRVLVSSGLPANGGLAKAMDAGIQRFIPKPYTAEVLLTNIRKELEGRDGGRS